MKTIVSTVAPPPCAASATMLHGLRPRREARRLTQASAARYLGVSRQSYADWEAGRRWPSANILPALAEMCRCSIEELYTNPEEAAQ